MTNTALLELSEEQLFVRGKRLYENKLYKVAREAFEQLASQYPAGPYVEYAQLKAADCVFNSSIFDEAAAKYSAFIQEFPGSTSVEYAKIHGARSYLLAFKGPGHDTTPLEEAQKILKPFMVEYPDSVYFIAALSYYNQAVDLIAQHEQQIIDFYQRTGQDRALAFRKHTFTDRYPNLLAAAQPEALSWYNFWSSETPEVTERPVILRAQLRPGLIRLDQSEGNSPSKSGE